jgi:EpsI family protein
MSEPVASDLQSRRMLPSRRDLLLGGAAAGAAAAGYVYMPHRQMKLIGDGALDRIIPKTIGDWRYETTSGLILPPADQLARLLYSQQVSRTYSAPDHPNVMLLMAYGSSQGGMLQIHRPEICYPAAGFRLSNTQPTSIPIGGGLFVPSRTFTAESDSRIEHVLYWTRIGDLLPVSWAGQRLAVVRANLHGDVPDGLLARVSMIAQDGVDALAILKNFVATMLQQMPPARRRMLIAGAAT